MNTKDITAIHEGDKVTYFATRKVAVPATVVSLNKATVRIRLQDGNEANVKPSKLHYEPDPLPQRKTIRPESVFSIPVGLQSGASGGRRGRGK